MAIFLATGIWNEVDEKIINGTTEERAEVGGEVFFNAILAAFTAEYLSKKKNTNTSADDLADDINPLEKPESNVVDDIVDKVDDVGESSKPGTLSNVEARKWYLEQEAKIPNLIDDTLPLEQQAKQAFDLRNQYRTQARELMLDRQLAESLYNTDPNPTWEQIIQKQIDKGILGDDIYKEIIESSQRSRTSINQSLGLE